MAYVHDTREHAAAGLADWQLGLAIALLKIDVPVKELAKRCGLSRSHFTRAFKASTGLPPHRWLLRYRIDCARQMLEQGSESLAQVALTCGFADQSHFTRVFHAIAGASPSAWRRRKMAGGFPSLPQSDCFAE